ncbi:hypothetical protein ACIF80_03680 [Streptomyces sp. NPDC085927]
MSTQADHGHELVPRPEQTPDALRTALAADPGASPLGGRIGQGFL